MRKSGTEFVDPVHLKTEAYADSRKFRTRTTIYNYQQPDVDFGDWALSHVPPDLGAVVDVGCGPGDYLRRLHRAGRADSLVGVDLSAGILSDARDVVPRLCVSDAQALPFQDRSFDRILCMHMLYHVSDIDQAIRELRRIGKVDGIALIATNGSEHHRAIRDTFDAAVADLSGGAVGQVLSMERRFRLEVGEAMLRAHFATVERHDLPRELVLPDSGPLIGYLESVRSFHESKLPDDVGWDDAATRFRERVQDEISHSGAFRSPIHAGVFVCR